MRKLRSWLLLLGAGLVGLLALGPASGLTALASTAGGSPSAAAARPLPPSPPGGPRGLPPRGPRPGAPGLAGTVTAVGEGGFTLQTVANATYQVMTSSATGYLLAPGWTGSSVALAVGEQVAVQGTVSGDRVEATTVAPRIWGVTGKVTAAGGDTAGVIEQSGRTATLQFGSSPGLQTGRLVQAVGRWTGDTLVVQAWRYVPDRVDGTVTAVGTDQATVRTPGGRTVTVEWSSATRFMAGPPPAAGAATVTVGAHLHAEGTLSGDTLQATLIDLGPGPVPGP